MDSAPNWGQITPPSRVLRQEKHTHTWVIDEGPSRGRRARRCRVRNLSCLLWRSLLNTRKWWCLSCTKTGENTRLCLAGVIYGIFTSGWGGLYGYMWICDTICSHLFLFLLGRPTKEDKDNQSPSNMCICTFECMSCMYCMCVHDSLCVWTSACSCLGQAWFLSAHRPPPCSKALLQGPKITSLSTLPGLWNNNTPGFPITAAPANGDGTENMCGQTRARGRGSKRSSRWQR